MRHPRFPQRERFVSSEIRLGGANEIFRAEGVPRCACGGIVKPDGVLYGEPLSEKMLSAATEALWRAGPLLVGAPLLFTPPPAWSACFRAAASRSSAGTNPHGFPRRPPPFAGPSGRFQGKSLYKMDFCLHWSIQYDIITSVRWNAVVKEWGNPLFRSYWSDL